MNYRKLYESVHGTIPVDDDGICYEVHHIDGNHDNNDIQNLTAIPIDTHFKVHFEQGDYHACFLIATRMRLSDNELSEIAKLLNKLRIQNGTHHFTGDRNPSKIRVKNGTHHLLKRSDGTSNSSDRVKRGTHNFSGSSTQQTRLKNGTHPSQVKWECPHCRKQGQGKGMFTRYHGDNCKLRQT